MTPDDLVLITSYLEPEHVARIRAAADPVPVIYEPTLIPAPRYASDHLGHPLERTPQEEERWRELLGRATILFDFDATHRSDLPRLAPRVRWVQATSAGIGQFVRRQGYAEAWPDAVFTTASGVHARPLAEFALMAMLGHVRGLLQVLRQQREHRWERFAGTEPDSGSS